MNAVNSMLSSAIRLSAPYLFAGLGGLLAQHCGIYNFALDGQLLVGAFFGYYVATITGENLFVALLAAIACGLFTGWLLGFLIIRFGASQLVVGLGLNTLLSGVTAFMSRLMDNAGTTGFALEKQIPIVNFGPLADIPIVGPLIFQHNVLTYLIIILFLFYAWYLKNTQSGLSLRAVGEHPSAAQTAGINVFRYRYLAMILSGGITAIGGAYMTLSQVGRFAEDMSGGRGWIAIAAIALGRWSPIGTFFSCLLFGFANAVANQVQVLNLGIPSQFAMMIPYVITVLALLGARGGKANHGPASLAKPFTKNR